MSRFVHLHVHTQYSILDGASSIEALFNKADSDGQTALAITDHGNMYGVKEFFKFADAHPNVKPIIGSEFYISRGTRFEKRGREDQSSYHLILLAKNLNGYRNLVKLSSLAFIEGFYYKPRIDHELLEKYHEDLICSSSCLAGEIARAIGNGDIAGAEEQIKWYKNLFGDDYYLEVMRHKTDVPGANTEVYPAQEVVNEKIFELAKKYDIKVIATNDVHFVSKEDGPAHDRLICLITNELYDEPKRLRYTQQEYLKTQDEMEEIFSDHPEVISNTLEVAEKVERYSIDSAHILPKFPLPEEFTKDISIHLEKYKEVIDAGKNDEKGNSRGEEFTWSVAYLCELCYKGAAERYGNNLSEEQATRIDFELKTISTMGFPDYFLIVQDFIRAARNQGTWVGPGRGSAAGSVVAYCLHITNIDPLKYDLLFERFLNPDRISMPDIDIDFDDDGRGGVYHYVEEKYGKDHISHVVTFGTMAAKSAIKDIARIHNLPLQLSSHLANIVPTRDIEIEVKGEDGKKETKVVKPTLANCHKYLDEYIEEYENGDSNIKNTLDFAEKLEGSIRQTGVHACATIIGRGDLTDYIPICMVKDRESNEEMLVSQYSGNYIEAVGMLKMDFLGLKTLSIQKECVRLIKQRFGIDIDVEAIPLNDAATYKLFSDGDTTAVFQFESDGMRKYLRELKPSKFEDIIAMNALYRPGPMDYIPDFIDRKHGIKPISYDIPVMETYLSDTYGITVYQEQVMLLSRLLSNFTRGESDTLRKAMGKKQKKVLDKLKPLFIERGMENGHDEKILEKIWGDWEKFASYAFNKSHATCYAWVGYQTAFLKAHYRSEFMAANMNRSLDKMEEIIKLMEDCRNSGIPVLGPDINESYATFSVNKDGNIRFGMAGIKGVGANVINAITDIRDTGGQFTDIYDFIERVPITVLNRKVMECLTYAGAFDSISTASRAQYFLTNDKGETFIEILLRYSGKFHNDRMSTAMSLFGDSAELKPVRPEFPAPIEYDRIEMLKHEKDVVGMYLSSHPLDTFKFEIKEFADTTIARVNEISKELPTEAKLVFEGKKKESSSILNKDMFVAGIVTSCETRISASNTQYCRFTVEDFSSSYQFALFGSDFEKFMKYTTIRSCLLIKLSTAMRFRGKDGNPPKYDLKIKGITLLSNIKENMIKKLKIDLPVEKLNAKFNKELAKVLKENKGPTRPYIYLTDDKSRLDAEFYCKKYSVSMTPQLIEWLEHNNITFSIEKADM